MPLGNGDVLEVCTLRYVSVKDGPEESTQLIGKTRG